MSDGQHQDSQLLPLKLDETANTQIVSKSY